MDDMERYGDYDTMTDDGVPAQRGGLVRVLKVAFTVTLFLLVALLLGRLLLSEYYPGEMKHLYISDRMQTLREQTGTLPAVKTQTLRFPYDDNDLDELNSNNLGTIFARHLYVIDATDEVQITVRINHAGLQSIAERYKRQMTAEEVLAALTFRLADNEGRVYAQVSYREDGALAMYRYVKLCFSEVELSSPADGEAPKWLRLETVLDGESEPYSYLLIYENTETHHTFRPYTPTGKELLE